jgi:hypothetical protein
MLTISLVQQYTSKKTLTEDKEGSPLEEVRSDVDLGWKTPKTKARRKFKRASEIIDQVDDEVGERERREEAMVSSVPLVRSMCLPSC